MRVSAARSDSTRAKSVLSDSEMWKKASFRSASCFSASASSACALSALSALALDDASRFLRVFLHAASYFSDAAMRLASASYTMAHADGGVLRDQRTQRSRGVWVQAYLAVVQGGRLAVQPQRVVAVLARVLDAPSPTLTAGPVRGHKRACVCGQANARGDLLLQRLQRLVQRARQVVHRPASYARAPLGPPRVNHRAAVHEITAAFACARVRLQVASALQIRRVLQLGSDVAQRGEERCDIFRAEKNSSVRVSHACPVSSPPSPISVLLVGPRPSQPYPCVARAARAGPGPRGVPECALRTRSAARVALW